MARQWLVYAEELADCLESLMDMQKGPPEGADEIEFAQCMEEARLQLDDFEAARNEALSDD